MEWYISKNIYIQTIKRRTLNKSGSAKIKENVSRKKKEKWESIYRAATPSDECEWDLKCCRLMRINVGHWKTVLLSAYDTPHDAWLSDL